MTTSNDPVLAYIAAREASFLENLEAWLRIPSISTESRFAADVRQAAEFAAEDFRQMGMPRVEIWPTAGHPAVFAEWNGAPGGPTALVYGHYDVQPVDPLGLWQSPPFEPTVRDGYRHSDKSSWA